MSNLFSRILNGLGSLSVATPEQEPMLLHASSTAHFVVCVNRVLASEGGYVNNPRDPGGETNYGITVSVARESGYKGSMRELSRDKAISIYRERYWDAGKCGDLPQGIVFQYFDACVNHGLKNAAKILQRALKVDDDGIIGPATLSAARASHQGELLAKFNHQRIKFYTSLSTFGTFGRGWMNRVADNLMYGALDV